MLEGMRLPRNGYKAIAMHPSNTQVPPVDLRRTALPLLEIEPRARHWRDDNMQNAIDQAPCPASSSFHATPLSANRARPVRASGLAPSPYGQKISIALST